MRIYGFRATDCSTDGKGEQFNRTPAGGPSLPNLTGAIQVSYPCAGRTTVDENRQSVAIRVHPRPIFKSVTHARGRTTMDENVLYLYPCGWCKGRNVVGAKSLQVSSTWMPVGTANCGTRPRPGST